MTSKYKKITTATALLAALAIGQVYIAISFAEPNSGASVAAAVPQQIVGILTTSNNRPITVNGANAISGATIATGAVIETPDGIGATIRIGSLASLCIAPNTKLSIEFERQGNAGTVRINVTEGCAILRTLKGTSGIVNSAQGNVGQINGATGGSIDVCLRAGTAPTVNQGAAVDAGAGASALDCGAAGAAAAPAGIPPAATAAFIGGGATGLYLLFRGDNPSPSAP